MVMFESVNFIEDSYEKYIKYLDKEYSYFVLFVNFKAISHSHKCCLLQLNESFGCMVIDCTKKMVQFLHPFLWSQSVRYQGCVQEPLYQHAVVQARHVVPTNERNALVSTHDKSSSWPKK